MGVLQSRPLPDLVIGVPRRLSAVPVRRDASRIVVRIHMGPPRLRDLGYQPRRAVSVISPRQIAHRALISVSPDLHRPFRDPPQGIIGVLRLVVGTAIAYRGRSALAVIPVCGLVP